MVINKMRCHDSHQRSSSFRNMPTLRLRVSALKTDAAAAHRDTITARFSLGKITFLIWTEFTIQNQAYLISWSLTW